MDAAIRHAEQVTRGAAVARAIVFTPDQPTKPSRKSPETSSKKEPVKRVLNTALGDALRGALKIPHADRVVSAPASAGPTKQAKKVASPTVGKTAGPVEPKKKQTKKAKGAQASGPNPKTSKKTKRKKANQARAQPRVPAAMPRKAPSPNARKATRAGICAARLAFNAKQKETRPHSDVVSPFTAMKLRWERDFSYIQRFQHIDPTAPDILAAQARLLAIEREWEHRASLAEDDPDYFPWPSTAPAAGTGSPASHDWEEIGMLAYLGYHVGRGSDLNAVQREALLSHIFLMRLPPLNSVAYMRAWGLPNTATRLQKMADGIATFARRAKQRRNSSLGDAIADWEADLSYLRRTYYSGRFDKFPWPRT
ncbi:hypothetical protein J2Y54_001248 [Sphingomonas sp. BE123]|uniref:hypothetical protein n=1 Tax=Sphingomonas sp. BE123 TaxID=2817842 RepID=UPI0028642242|nr:hypothetical protein [Sphingomonas sp. BE123]MDR6851755.1 hypothetical protein [Sphingomonas sp. BE123]